jgi:hypothetical protein
MKLNVFIPLVVIVALASGCSITPKEIAESEKVCTDHDGLALINVSEQVEATCNDGSTFLISLKEE